MAETDPIHKLVEEVRANPKYKFITIDLVQQLCQETLDTGVTGKPAVKAVRNKLHQVGGAYFRKKMNITNVEGRIEALPVDLQSETTKQLCQQVMENHTSTAERLPIIDEFFQTCLASLAPVHSVIDLACGLNPFAIPWMPLAEHFTYTACDIYEDMLGLVGNFFHHMTIQGVTMPCNLVNGVPKNNAQVAFLLKSIPCLEQITKHFGAHIMELIPAKHILISYPVHSLGGRKKGMLAFYRQHFYQLIQGKPWKVTEFIFQTELAFLVNK